MHGLVAGVFVPFVPLVLLSSFWLGQPAGAAGPIQHYILIDLGPSTDVLVLDRWYLDHHARALGDWRRRV